MSVEFKNQGFPGWFQDDPNKPTILRANAATITSKSGGISPIVAEFNFGDGSIQYYEVRGGVGFNGPRVPLFIQSASGAKNVQNQGNLDELKPEDISRIESSVKDVAFRANQKLASDKEKEDLKNSQYYKSLSNKASGLSNIPPQEGTGGGAPGADVPTSDDTPLAIDFKIEGNKQTDFKNWRYPIGKSDQDVIKFTMREYIPLSGLVAKEKKTRQTGSPLGTVVLPIQPTIIDNNSVTWQQDTLNPLEVAGLELFSGAVSEGTDGAKRAIDRIIGNLGPEKENVEKGLLAAIAGQAIGKNVLARVSGAILNPNIELLFNAPDLRTFNYRFQLSAREKEESKQIRGIIGWFKAGMAVRRTPSELFLVTPNIFDIQYIYKPPIDDDIEKNDKNHPYLNRIKTCALTNCSVDYTPTGSYMTFGDGSMVSYTINLIFQELEPIYQDDYKAVGTEIGY
jgi:hypothetical protein